MLRLLPLYFGFGVASILICPKSFAWSERGHNLIARVAARLALEELGPEQPLGQVLLDKEHVLGHLANVPDIVWKNTDQHTKELNFPTHFFDVDEVLATPRLAQLPLTLSALEALAPGHVKAAKFGTAPFRIQQLFTMMRTSFAAAKAANKRKELVDAVNEALLYGGLMAHFVGDLAQPLHTTNDYDGFATGEGGLHAYFEAAVISAYDLALPQRVYDQAVHREKLKALRKSVSALPAATASEPLQLAYALTIDSYQALPKLRDIDRKAAVLKAGSDEHGMHLPAKRKPAAVAAAAFAGLATERLAAAAEVLSYLWLQAWRQAGMPDLDGYQSYAYPLAPAMIDTPYMAAVTPPPPPPATP